MVERQNTAETREILGVHDISLDQATFSTIRLHRPMNPTGVFSPTHAAPGGHLSAHVGHAEPLEMTQTQLDAPRSIDLSVLPSDE